jgi:hypothetical protein
MNIASVINERGSGNKLNVEGEWLALLLHIWGSRIQISARRQAILKFSWFYSAPPGKFPDRTLNSTTNCIIFVADKRLLNPPDPEKG